LTHSTEAFSRVRIDGLLRDVGWSLTDGTSVHFEYTLPSGTRADYVLCDRRGRPLAVLEAKRTSIDPVAGRKQALEYAEALGVAFVFLSNGDRILFLDRGVDAHARDVATVFSQEDLERKVAARVHRRDPASVPVDRSIAGGDGRSYQIDCIETLTGEVARGRRKLLVEMATGTGKTRMAAAFIKRLYEAGIVTRVLFLVDRIELATQAEDAFVDHLKDYPCQVLRAGRSFDYAKRVTIATLQTMINEYRALSSGYFDLVVTDECHRSIYGKWSGVLRHFDSLQLGLTATPCVVDDADLPDPEDGAFVRDTLRFFEVDRPTFRYTLKEAIEDGHLAPYKIYRARTVKTAAHGGFEVKRKELDWSALEEATRAEFEALFESRDTITVDPRALERKFTIPERNRAMVREFRDVVENGFKGSDGIRRLPQDGKTIVFAVTKRHAETLARMFDDHFADRKPDPTIRYADFVVSDLGAGPQSDAGQIIKRFKKEAFPKILVSVNMLDTGFDCPEVVNLVFARFTRSAILYQQMRGRGTRKAPHIRKTSFTMFDFVGVTDFHGDDDETIPGGIGGTRPPGVGPGEPRRLLELDVDDHIDPLSRDWVTLDSSGRVVRTDAHEARAAELGALFEAWVESRPWTAEQQRWLRLIKGRIMADAESLTGFWDYDLDDPPLRGIGGYAKAVSVFGGRAALDDVLGGLNVAVFDDRGKTGPGGDTARPRA
jgi:type I restriction enzyme R subunit